MNIGAGEHRGFIGFLENDKNIDREQFNESSLGQQKKYIEEYVSLLEEVKEGYDATTENGQKMIQFQEGNIRLAKELLDEANNSLKK